jgi:hypothetical protein
LVFPDLGRRVDRPSRVRVERAERKAAQRVRFAPI